jgi:phospholipase/carboxylesterase
MEPLLSCVEVGPADASAAVVWMHGLGADGHDFAPIVPMLGCPHVRFVFPHAPSLPVTINQGFVMPAWYDILTLDGAEGRENPTQVLASAQRIAALLRRETERGVEARRIVVAGFSQGAAMALHVGTRWPEALGGVIVLSGYHVRRDAFAAERSDANRGTPMFFAHGRADPLVPIAWGRAARADVAQWSTAELAWADYAMGHEACPEEIEAVGEWLRARLPPDPARG